MFICVFNCANSRLRRYTSGVIPANSNPNIVFKFNFNTPEWDLVPTKIAVFSYRGENYSEPLDENNMCTVPAEVLCQGYFQVSVHGGGIITNMVRVPVTEAQKDEIDDGCTCKGGKVYVPEVTPDNILVFTLSDEATDERLEFDIDKSNDWNATDNTVGSNYIWEPMV